MPAAGGAKPADHRAEKRPCPARGLDSYQGAQVASGVVAGQVEDQVDDPSPGEDLAVLDGLGWYLRQRREARIEHELSCSHRPRVHAGSLREPADLRPAALRRPRRRVPERGPVSTDRPAWLF